MRTRKEIEDSFKYRSQVNDEHSGGIRTKDIEIELLLDIRDLLTPQDITK